MLNDSLAKQLTSVVPAILDVVPHIVTDIVASVLAILDIVLHIVTDIVASVLAIIDVLLDVSRGGGLREDSRR
jgi:phage-related protein